MNYTSIFTGEEIDAAIQKALTLELKGDVLSDTSGVKGSTGLPWAPVGGVPGLGSYPLIALTGYKEGLEEATAGKTTQIIISTKALRSGGNILNLPFSVRESNGDPWSTTIYFTVAGPRLQWKTATAYGGSGGSDEFIVTRAEGFTVSGGQ